ncbi:hypothetical protein F4811DRAFT_572924 [Daldinia bambusicola]|nr:hypothetical protein F4811DRAFT_572924 [Daldinia bambusicola]
MDLSPWAALKYPGVTFIYFGFFIYACACLALGFKFARARWPRRDRADGQRRPKILGMDPWIIAGIGFSILFVALVVPTLLFIVISSIAQREHNNPRRRTRLCWCCYPCLGDDNQEEEQQQRGNQNGNGSGSGSGSGAVVNNVNNSNTANNANNANNTNNNVNEDNDISSLTSISTLSLSTPRPQTPPAVPSGQHGQDDDDVWIRSAAVNHHVSTAAVDAAVARASASTASHASSTAHASAAASGDGIADAVPVVDDGYDGDDDHSGPETPPEVFLRRSHTFPADSYDWGPRRVPPLPDSDLP